MNIISHNRSNYYGITNQVDNLPHFVNQAIQAAAYLNQYSPIKGKLWSGTPISAALAGKAYASPSNNTSSSGLTPNTSSFPTNATFGNVMGPTGPNQAPIAFPTGNLSLQSSGGSGGGTPTGGSGGGDGGGSNPYYDQGTGITFPSYEAFAGEVDRYFGESSDLLNKTEADTRAREGDYYATASAPFEAQKPILSQARDEGLQLNAKQKAEEQLREQDALARARRLFQELTQGTRQRFGGSSSAGEFANQILGREHMKNISSVQDTAGQNYANLYDKAQTIQNQYATQLQSIEKEKEGAIAQARLMFQEKIDNINNSRLALSQNKAQMKLAELQNLRNTVLNIQQQAQQYKQSIQSAIANTQAQLQAQIQGYKAQSGQAVNMNAIPNAMMSAYGGSQGANFLSNPIGNIGLRDEDRQRLGF